MTELYKRYRPKDLDEVVGQSSAVTVLKSMMKKGEVPHAIMLTGPAGCGKTTLAYIIGKMVKCHPSEFHEYDIADLSGVDDIRAIRRLGRTYPIQGKSKVIFLDECHRMSKNAEDALLKPTEKIPNYMWYILATTDPLKMQKTLRSRCTKIELKPIGDDVMTELLVSTAAKESRKDIDDEVFTKIVKNAEGSAREALVFLETVLRLDSEEEMLEAIETVQKTQAINLCRLLLNFRPDWSAIAKLLKEMEGEEPEGLRRMVLGYMRSVVLGGGKMAGKAFQIQCCFERNFYDTGNAGLQMACWEAVNGK